MTKDEIIELAKKAGAKKTYHRFSGNISYTMLSEDIERFAALVAAAERDACAKVCESEGQRIDASWSSCAAAIRARGEK